MALNLQAYFFCDSGGDAGDEGGGAGIDREPQLDFVDDSLDGAAGVCGGEGGIVGLTRTLAHELGPQGIRVNAVLPGAIATEKQKRLVYTPEYKAEILARQALKRDILPEDVARLVLFLAADDSSGITNQSYVVDGGWV